VRLAPTPRPPRISRAGLIVLLYTGLALAGVAWGAARGHANVFVLPGRTVPRTLQGIGAGVALALAVAFATRWATHRLEWARTLMREFREILGPLAGTEIFLLAAASSVGEETLFRGAMLPHLGLWLSSALFALPHIGPGLRFLPWTATSLFAGLAFGQLFVWSGDLGAAICAHFLINLLNLRYITKKR
jgi:hypothetical protein